jgi:hypothetical protein
MGTLIRHAGLNQALSIVTLAVAMIESPFRARLVPAISRAALSLSRC